MSNNSQKTPLARSLNRFAEKKWQEAFQLTGKALPCSVVSVSGAIMTVKFEVNTTFTLPNVTVPMVGPEYIRYPMKAGDMGVVFPADARLSGVSGIGGGVADLSTPGNLTALVFLPCSNVKWSEVDPAAVTLYGPNGVALRDTESKSKITITPSGIAIETVGAVTVIAGGSATIDATGIGLKGGSGTQRGVVQGNCVCAFTGAPHPQISATVTATI
jgi:hypothetical protein